MTRMGNLSRILLAAVAVTLLVVALLAFTGGTGKKYLTATFPRTVSLYEGSDVRILGVTVGKVTSVTPAGTAVKVKMWYDDKYDVPADANAVLIAPAIVGDRFIQLTPVYHSGPELPDNANLGLDRTEIPLELDEIYGSIDNLVVSLGPQGANKEGALSKLLDVTANNFAGEGRQFHQTIQNLSDLTQTLDNNKDELFGAAEQVDRFVKALADNDQTVRDFNDSLASASTVLAQEREELGASLHNLGIALKNVSGFVRENRDILTKDIAGLNSISKILVKQRAALDEALDAGPTALDNLYHTYNPSAGTLDTRANLGENINDVITRPDVVLCGILSQVDKSGALCDALTGAGRAAALARAHSHRPVEVEHIDPSLGGLLEVTS